MRASSETFNHDKRDLLARRLPVSSSRNNEGPSRRSRIAEKFLAETFAVSPTPWRSHTLCVAKGASREAIVAEKWKFLIEISMHAALRDVRGMGRQLRGKEGAGWKETEDASRGEHVRV